MDELLALAEDAADGSHTHEVAIGLKQSTEAAIRADLANAKTKRDAHAAAVADKPALATTVRVQYFIMRPAQMHSSVAKPLQPP